MNLWASNWQSLRRRAGLMLGAVLSLGLALGAALTVFSAIDAVMLRPLPYPAQDEIVVVRRAQGPERIGPPVCGPSFLDLKRQVQSLSALAAVTGTTLLTRHAGNAERWSGLEVSADFAAVYALPAHLGRMLGASDMAAEAAPAIVLSHALWQRRFASDPAAVGRELLIDGVAHRIVGVAHPALELPGAAEAMVPLKLPADGGTRGNNYLNLSGRLAPGRSVAEAQAELRHLATVLAAAHSDAHAQLDFDVQLLRDRLTLALREPLWLLLAAIGLLLVVGLASLINLLLASYGARRREFATRAALGLDDAGLTGTVLRETLILLLGAGVAAVLVSSLALGLLPQWLLDGRELSLWPRPLLALASVLLLLLGASVLAVSYFTRRQLRQAPLAGSTRSGGLDRSGQQLRRGLVVVQLALSLVLVAGAVMMTTGMRQLLRSDPGFSTESLYALRVAVPADVVSRDRASDFQSLPVDGGGVGRFVLQLETELAQQAGIRAAGVTNVAPIVDGGGMNSGFQVAGAAAPPPGGEPLIEVRYVSPGYHAALGQRLIQGRGLDTRPVTATERRGIVVNQALVERHLGGRDPLGARLIVGGGIELPILGVVSDARQDGPGDAVREELYLNYLDWSDSSSNLVLIVRSDLAQAELFERVRSVVAGIHPDAPVYEITSFDAAASTWTRRREFLLSLMQFFGSSAVAIALVGLYALFAHAVAQRRLEFGLRQALGAAPADVWRRIVGEALVVAGTGVLIGLVVSQVLTPWYRHLVHGLQQGEWWVQVATALGLMLAALAAILAPAWRALQVTPVEALRMDT